MSELITNNTSRTDFRKHLLATASALAFGALASAPAHADDVSRPTVWIELGGQMEFMKGVSSSFVAPFIIANPDSATFDPVSPLEAQKPTRFSFGEEGKISIQPKHSDWIFSAALRFGRSGSKRYIHQQTRGIPIPSTAAMFKNGHHYMSGEVSYSEDRVQQNESHLVLDFQAGKDVGIGLFGKDGSSVLSAGVRMARISSSATVGIRARPEIRGSNFVSRNKYKVFYHQYQLTGGAERSFHGIGPSVSWNGSAPVFGTPGEGELAIDWNANAAVLFGKQKALAHQQTNGDYKSKGVIKSPYTNSTSPGRSRSVVVPNLGGSFAMAYHFDNAKLDIGYRADLYFNAMDTGMDTRQTSNVLFHGPFATLSIGLGG